MIRSGDLRKSEEARNRESFHESNPPLAMALPYVSGQDLRRRELLGIEFISGEDKAAFLQVKVSRVWKAMAAAPFRRESPCAGRCPVRRASRFGIIGHLLYRRLFRSSELQRRPKRFKCRLRIGATGKRLSTQRLKSLGFLLTALRT
jgi:hypothetical protein